jgi:hypothetical protein
MKLFIYPISFLFFVFSTIMQAETEDKDIARDLKATLSSDSISVELNWKEPQEEGDIIIARSNQIIDSFEKLGIADSLGKYPSNKKNRLNSFKDINLKPGTYFYAIVLVSQIKKKRVKLFPNQNFTTQPVEVPIRKEEPAVVPIIEPSKLEVDSISNLKIRNGENSVILSWTPPLEAEYTDPVYTIYRSIDSLHNPGLLDKAEKIGEVFHPETSFIDDKVTSSSSYYYGVTVSIKNRENAKLEENKSFKRFFYVVETKEKVETDSTALSRNNEPKLPLKVSDIKAKKRKDGVLLSWTTPKSAEDNKTIYSIYESDTSFNGENNAFQSKKAKKIGTVIHPDSVFLHPILKIRKDFYYGITTQNKEEEENLALVTSLHIKPKKKKGSKDDFEVVKANKIESNEDKNLDFETIYKTYFLKNKFKDSARKFISLGDKIEEKEAKAKSFFYAAVSLYQLKEYEKALKILLKEVVQLNYDKERVDFYTKRCLEKR